MTYYIRPMHYVDSPQQYDGATKRLAGSLIWFAGVEIINRSDTDILRRIISLDDWDGHISSYSKDDKTRLETLYANIISDRLPLEMGGHIVRFDQPQVMGILNITPDSFSDGGQFSRDINGADSEMYDAAVEAGYAMARDGAAIIDIGGESTRPGAKTLWEGDESARILPTIERLAGGGVTISVDTRKASVMEQSLGKGAAIINDISALGFDKRAVDVARDFDAPVILMHAPSQGDNPHDNADYDDVIYDVYDWLENRVNEIEGAGISRDQIMIDVGIGFGKTLSQNLSLINNLSLFHGIGCAIVFGASRKRLIGALSNEVEADRRLGGSVGLAMKAIHHGVHIVRVHDVFETVQSVRIWRGLRDAALTAPA